MVSLLLNSLVIVSAASMLVMTWGVSKNISSARFLTFLSYPNKEADHRYFAQVRNPCFPLSPLLLNHAADNDRLARLDDHGRLGSAFQKNWIGAFR